MSSPWFLKCFYHLSGSHANIGPSMLSSHPSSITFISPPSVCFSPSLCCCWSLSSPLPFLRFVPLLLQDPLLSLTMLFTHKCRFRSLFLFVYLCYPPTPSPPPITFSLSLYLYLTVHLPLLPHVCTLSAAVLVCLPARILPCFSSMLDFGH